MCSFQEHFPSNRVKLGSGERQIVLIGGKACIEDGPLAHFAGELPDLSCLTFSVKIIDANPIECLMPFLHAAYMHD